MKFCKKCAVRIKKDLAWIRSYGAVRLKTRYETLGDSSQCVSTESEKTREKTWEGLRNRIYSRTLIPPIIPKGSGKENPASMSRVPLIGSEANPSNGDLRNMVMLEAGISGDTWRYCVERERLGERSEWFRAMLMGPLAPPPSDPPPLIKLQHVEKRAFDCFLKYLHDEPIKFQSVSTARATLDAAHQYLCPGLADLAIEFLSANLNSSTALEIYQGLGLYAIGTVSSVVASPNSPTAPSAPRDDAGEKIARLCMMLRSYCIYQIDSDPTTVFGQERFEELSSQEVAQLARRDRLNLPRETILFSALDRWAASECRKHGLDPSPCNKRAALPDEVWYSVRYLLMTDREFIEGPMASGILSSEESAFIVARILGHRQNQENGELRSPTSPLSRLSNVPRRGTMYYEDQCCGTSKPGKREQQDNRKNRRKECVHHGQRTCATIGDCLVRVLAYVFD